jgi:hypothetical protein
MQIDWTFDDENTYGVVYAMVELDAHETDELVQRAYERFGRLIKADPGTERERAAELLTDRELERFVAESVMAVAADDAMARLDRNVMFVPQCERREPLREHEPFAFEELCQHLICLDCQYYSGRPAEKETEHRHFALAKRGKSVFKVDSCFICRVNFFFCHFALFL